MKMAPCPIFVALRYRCSLEKRLERQYKDISMLLPLFPNPSKRLTPFLACHAMPLLAHLKFCACFDSYSCIMNEKVRMQITSGQPDCFPLLSDVIEILIDSKIDAGLPLHNFCRHADTTEIRTLNRIFAFPHIQKHFDGVATYIHIDCISSFECVVGY